MRKLTITSRTCFGKEPKVKNICFKSSVSEILSVLQCISHLVWISSLTSSWMTLYFIQGNHRVTIWPRRLILNGSRAVLRLPPPASRKELPVRSLRMLLTRPEHWHLGALAMLQGMMWNWSSATHCAPFSAYSALYPSQQTQDLLLA